MSAKNIADVYPLSPTQEGLLFHHLYTPHSGVTQVICRLHNLDVATFEHAWQQLIDRHPVLRSAFVWKSGDKPLQVVGRKVGVVLDRQDWRTLPVGVQEERFEAYLEMDRKAGFNLMKAPVMRLALLQTGEHDYYFLWSHHHILMDGWSVSLVLSDFFELYQAISHGDNSHAPHRRPYRDYIGWLQQQNLGEAEKFWRHLLRGFGEPTRLGLERQGATTVGSPPQSENYEEQSVFISEEATAALQRMAREQQVTLNTVVQGAWAMLLSCYSGSEDVLFGATVSGRPATLPGAEDMVGQFINTLPVRARVASEERVGECLKRIQAQQAEVRQYEFSPLVEVQAWSEVPRGTPLFESILVFQNYPVTRILKERLGDLEVSEFRSVESTLYPLTLIVLPAVNVRLNLICDRERYDAASIKQLLRHLSTLLDSIALNPDQRLRDLSLLTPAERHQLLVEFNDTEADYARELCLHHLFEAQVARTPEAIAFLFEGKQVSYDELNRRANRLAHYLRRKDVGPEARVGICMQRSIEMVVALLAVLKVGGAYVPLDPNYPRERLEMMAEDAGLRVVIGTVQDVERVGAWLCEVVRVDAERERIIEQSEKNPPPVASSSDSAAYIMYTSGSTGRPKGAVGLHRGAVNRFEWMWKAYPFAAREVCCQKTSLTFGDSIWEIFGPLLQGVRNVIIPDEKAKDPYALVEVLAEHNVTRIVLVPTLLRLILDSHANLQARLPKLRWWVTSGEALPVELYERFVVAMPQSVLLNLYGASELSADVTWYETTNGFPSASVPIGRPIANTQIYLLNEHRQPVPPGIPGELYVGGDGLARGYHDHPSMTAERFIPDHFSRRAGARLYRTGDRARYLPDGTIEYLGRRDAQVKVRGFRIELGEIEAVLRKFPPVKECIVTVKDYGASGQQLVGYVITKTEEGYVGSRELQSYLREHLPEHMVPPVFMKMEEWPLTPSGKVNVRALPNPEMQRDELTQRYVVPGTPVEQIVAGIWSEVLRVEHVGAHDNFFDLGGHSLLMMQVQRKIREAFQRDLSLVEMFKYPTVHQLAKHLKLAPGDEADPPSFQQSSERAELVNRQEKIEEKPNRASIAIVSMSGRFPGAKNVEEFWSNLRDGVESVSTFSDEELLAAGLPPALLHDPSYVRAKGMLDDIEMFDAAFFGFTPREAEISDPQHRLFLECAWEALERGGYDSQRYAGRIGVYAGTSISSYLLLNLATNLDIVDSVGMLQTMLGNDKDYVPLHVSYKLNLKGPSVNVQTACSTSLVAVHLACQSLLTGECDMALAGGVTITLPKSGYQYREGGINSPDGHCRPFDAAAAGTLFGNGAGIVLLKRLDDALADGDIIHAIIRGSAINNDGSLKLGFTAPSIEGQSKVIAEAQARAGISADSISYVETHGTGTPIGDPIEVAALTQSFRATTTRGGFCALGSVKSNFGHLDAAAGIAGLIKTVLALKHRQLPPTLHFTAPNPKIDFASSPFYVNHTLTDWTNGENTPRRAGVSSFGFGGTNAHVVLEESPAQLSAPSSRGSHLLILSARSTTALDRMTENLRRHLQEHPELNIADVAFTLQIGRREFAHRRAIVCTDIADAVVALSDRSCWHTHEATSGPSGVVLMYSGQGAQYVQVGSELYEREAVFRRTVDECAAVLHEELGFDLREVLFPAADAQEQAARRLRETEATQPALFVIEYALTKLWQQWGVETEALMGHSVGECVAACVSGVLSEVDALRLVARRGRLMQQMARGAMLAVRLSEPEMQRWLREEYRGPEVWLAAVNSPQQCVISGSDEAVAVAAATLEKKGVGCRRLETSHGFHSALMEEAAKQLGREMEALEKGRVGVKYISNVSGRWAQDEEVREGGYWARQMLETVRWWRGIEEVLESGAKVLLEVGPGEVLKQMVAEGLRGSSVAVLSTLGGTRKGGEERHLVETLGELWVRGVGVSWGGMYKGEERRRVELPAYAFERERYWIEARDVGEVRRSESEKTRRVASAEKQKEREVGKWFYAPVWKQSVAVRRREKAGRWLVFAEESGLSDELIAWLEAQGAGVINVRAGERYERVAEKSFVVPLQGKEEFVRLAHELNKDGWWPEHVLHLWNVTPQITVEANVRNGHSILRQQIEQFEAVQSRSFYSLLYLVRALAAQRRSEPIRISVLTTNVQRVTGLEQLEPAKATILGLCRVIGQEYPHITCQNIDIELPWSNRLTLVKRLMAEVEAKPTNMLVAYRGTERWVQTYERVPLDALNETRMPVRVRAGGVYLITGGLGRVGLELAEELAKSARAKLVLTGRAAFPARTEWPQWLETHDKQDEVSLKIKKLQALETQGAEVLVVRADVSDLEQMKAAIAQAEEHFGALSGVIHAAGLVGERAISSIAETGVTEAGLHFAPKAHGLMVLERLLQGRELDFCLLVSSLSAVLGGLGFAAYAAANSYMDAFTQQHKDADEFTWLSVNWDAWRFGDEETPHVREDVPLGMTAEEGRDVLRRVLEIDGAAQLIVSTGDLEARLKRWVRLEPLQTHADRTEDGEGRMMKYARPALRTNYVEPRNGLEQQVAQTWEELLGVAPVGVEDNFFELGGHSLLATQVISRVREAFGEDIALRNLFEQPTVASLAQSINVARLNGPGLEAPPIVRVPRDERLPLSFAQQRLWFLNQMEPGSNFYNIPVAVRLTGRLDVLALERTLTEVVRRHEVLRTSFEMEDGTPRQVIKETENVRLKVTDLSDLLEPEREAEIRRLAAEEFGRPFDLVSGPLLRAQLLRLKDDEHVALVTMHHIVSDAWSIGVLIREIAALYKAILLNLPSPLPDLSIQYADFAAWQRQWLQGEVLEKRLSYWRDQLLGAPPILELPTDRPRPAVQTFHGQIHMRTIPRTLVESLKELSRRHEATLFMTLLAAFNILLSRYSGQQDILVGTPIANRNQLETEGLIGFFVNTLVLRTDMSGDPTFAELLARVREAALGAYAHQDLPFEKLVEELHAERDLSRSPLFQVMITLQNAPGGTLELPGLTIGEVRGEYTTAKFDLGATFIEEIDGPLLCSLEYATDLFDASTIERMGKHFEGVLLAIVESVDQKVWEISLLTEEEEAQLRAWNETTVEYPQHSCIHALFEEQVERTPHAVAVIFEDEQVSYRELNERSNQLARYLRELSVGTEVIVGICLERSVEMIVGVLGVLKAGGAYLPIEPSYPLERISFMLEDAGARLLLTAAEMSDRLALDNVASSWCNLCLDTEWERIAALPAQNLPHNVGAENLAYVIYTSGSTGRPKGVLVEHGHLLNTINTSRSHFTFNCTDVMPVLASFAFDISLFELLMPLSTGGCALIVSKEDVLDMLRLVARLQRATLLHCVPSLMWQLVEWLRQSDGVELRQLRQIFTGGDSVPSSLLEALREELPKAQLRVLYGPTEATIICASHEVRKTLMVGKMMVGRPLSNVKLRVVDARGKDVPVGIRGEIWIGGVGVTRGYLGREELTREKYVTEEGQRFYRTGDIGRYLPNGEIEFLGRADEQVKIRGYRIELGEIEAALVGHAAVREAAVVVKGEGGEKRLAAYVVAEESVELKAVELREHLRSWLPEYMQPQWVVLVEALPLTSNGKVDRRALARAEVSRDEGAGIQAAPRTPAEEVMAAIWAEVLAVKDIGIHDNFFELGGDSILSIQVVARANRAGLRVTPKQLFQHPTVAGLAAVVESNGVEGYTPSDLPLIHIGQQELDQLAGTETEIEDVYPLSSTQQGILFHTLYDPELRQYCAHIWCELHGELDERAFKEAWREVIDRHAVLRTAFIWQDLEQPLQLVHRRVLLPWLSFDWRSHPPLEQQHLLEQFFDSERARGFHPSKPPLLRLALIRTGQRSHHFVWSFHHLVLDGWSLPLLLREVFTLYKELCSGQVAEVARARPYRDYIAWLREQRVDEAERFWRAMLRGFSSPTALGIERRSAGEGAEGEKRYERQEVRLSAEATACLQKLAREQQVTLNTVVQGAWALLLSRYSGQEDVVFGAAVSGRPATLPGMEEMVGLFVNTLPVRVKVSSVEVVGECLKRIQEQQAEVRQYEHSPLVQVQGWSEVGRGVALFDSILVFENYPVGEALREWSGALEVRNVQAVESTNYPFVLYVVPAQELVLGMIHDTQRYEAQSITRMIGHLQVVLEEMATRPGQKLSSVSLLTPAEERQLLLEFNDTFADYSPERYVHELFEEQAARTPDALALTFEGVNLSYRELNARANQLAHHLRAEGVEPDQIVGVLMDRSIEMVIALLGILKSGGAYLPLEPSYPRERLSFMLSDARPRLLLSHHSLATSLLAPPVFLLDADWPLLAAQPDTAPTLAPRPAPNNLAYVMYTSGSTGRPKGVMVTHASLANYTRWFKDAFPLSASDAVLQMTPFSFDASVWEFWAPLVAGARLVVARSGGHKEAGYLFAVIRREAVTRVQWVPTQLRVLMEVGDGGLGGCASVREVYSGGEVLTRDLAAMLLETGNGRVPRLYNQYGPTETTIAATCWECKPESELDSVPIGFPIANTKTYILDKHLEPVPVGMIGELYIGGEGLARGYLNRPDLTAEKFLPNPFSETPGERLYRTGDLASYLPDGAIEYLGRIDRQIKIKGFRIELGEIEAALNQHPDVDVSVVEAKEVAGGEKRLVAYVIGSQGASFSTSELRDYLSEKLPEHFVPATFIKLDALPLTPNGKLDRNSLPAPDWSVRALKEVYIAPRLPLEILVAAIWAEVLGVKDIGVHDNFFELGGDSILSIQVVARANCAGLRLTLKQLFQHPTVAGLATVAESGSAPLASEQGEITGEAPLTPIQRWFFEQPLVQPSHYNQSLLFAVRRQLDYVALHAAVRGLLRQHDALRLRFERVEGGEGVRWRQWHEPLTEAMVEQAVLSIDLRGVSAEELGEAIREECERTQRSLELERGPLVRVVWMQTGPEPEDGRLLIVIHHLVIDGVSWRIVLEDLERAYAQAAEGQQVELGAKTTSYRRWAEVLYEEAKSGLSREEVKYWEEVEEAVAAGGDAQSDNETNTEDQARSVEMRLSVEQTRRLLQEVPAAYHTRINDMLLTALARTLWWWRDRGGPGGVTGVAVEVEGHGREEVGEALDLSRTVGWFTSIFPVVLSGPATEDVDQALKRVKEQLRAIPRNGLGYGLLRHSSVSEKRQRVRAQVGFNYLGQLTSVAKAARWLEVSGEPAGAERDAGGQRAHEVEVSGMVVLGELRMRWEYNGARYSAAEMQAVVGRYREELEGLIEHCLEEGVGGFTPSDFPLADLDQQVLDRIAANDDTLSDIYSLAPLQHGLLFHSLYGPSSGEYVVQLTCTISGEVDTKAFEQAWQEVINRHSVLRTYFVWHDLKEPVQIVRNFVRVPWPSLDWRSSSSAEQQHLLSEFLATDRLKGFDLQQPPLMRLALIRIDDDSYRFVWSFHHLLLDGWSMPLVIKEVLTFYEALSKGQAVEIAKARPFVEYIRWLRRPEIKAAEGFWRGMLKGFTAPTTLGIERVQGAAAKQRYKSQQVSLTDEETQRLQQLAREQQVTLNTVVQGAWALLLSRYSGQEDVVFGATMSGRPATLPGVEEMVGLFINTLPVRVQMERSKRVGEYLRRIQEQQVEVKQYEYSPLVEVQGWSEIERGTPMFETLMVFENYPVDGSLKERLGGSRLLNISEVQSVEHTHYPLTVGAVPGSRMELRISYDTDRFEETTINRMMEHLQNILEAIVADTGQVLAQLPMLSEREQEQLVVEWNDTGKEYAREACLHELFAAQAARTPAAIAVSCEGEQLRYQELNERANQVGHYLQAMGVGPEVLVGLCMERSVEMIVGILGILKAGGAYVPVDPQYPVERQAGMLEDAGVNLVLTQSWLPAHGTQTVALTVELDGEWEAISRESRENPSSGTAGQNLAYVIYTSGSSGRPKAVAIEHQGVCNLAAALSEAFAIGNDSRVLQFASLSFDASVPEIFVTLGSGGTLCVAPAGELLVGEGLQRVLSEQQISTVILPPTVLRGLEGAAELAALQTVVVAGEQSESATLQRWLSGGRRVLNAYGPTETSVGATMWVARPEELERGKPRLGRALSNVQVYVLDGKMRVVPVGVRGEIYIGGAGVGRGYLRQAGLTAGAFVPHPYSAEPGARLYRTGDQARWLADGTLEFLGRIDQQVKVRGFRIELGEVEAVLSQHPAVRQAIVLLREEQPGDKRLAGYVVAEPETQPNSNELRQFLKNKLPEYMVPSAFVMLESLPLNSRGKVDRAALPAPDGSRPELESSYVVPRTEAERNIAEAWQEVLRLERIGLYDNFFDLGGHSLLMIEVHDKLREKFEFEVSMTELFEYPSVNSLAEHLSRQKNAGLIQEQQNKRAAKLRERRNRLRQQRTIRSRSMNFPPPHER